MQSNKNIYGGNTTINTNSNNVILPNATVGKLLKQQRQGNRVIETHTTTHPIKRTADLSSSSPTKRPRINQEPIVASAILNNDQITSICETKINAKSWTDAHNIISNNKTLLCIGLLKILFGSIFFI